MQKITFPAHVNSKESRNLNSTFPDFKNELSKNDRDLAKF